MQAKYDKIGIGYNSTRKGDKYITERIFHHLNPKRDGLYLDIGCGTGNYTIELQKKGFKFIGIDPSKEMIDIAKQRNNKVDWQIGKAEKIDLKNESINGIVAMLTIHHWQDLYQGLKELNRILKVDGKIIIFTSTPEQMKNYWLNHYFPQMLEDSMKQMPQLEKVKNILTDTGFQIIQTEKYFVKNDLEDLFLYCGKNRPELYLNSQLRKGISSFSSLANINEVNNGIKLLQNDINSGKIKVVIKSFENDLGDYLFVTTKKVN